MTRNKTRWLAMLIAGITSTVVLAQDLFLPVGPEDGSQKALAAFEQNASFKRVRVAMPDRSVFEGDTISLNLFPDINVQALRTDIGETGVKSKTWTGRLDDNHGTACFLINRDRVSGKIHTDSGHYAVLPAQGGGSAIVEFDASAFDACGMPDNVGSPPPAKDASPGDGPKGAPKADSDNIRVLVAFTTNAQIATSNTMNMTMQELIELAVLESNQGYANSDVNLRIELARLFKTFYTETTGALTDVNRLQAMGDGFIDNAHPLRDDYDADMVGMIVDEIYPIAGLVFGFDYTDPSNMFMVAEYDDTTGNFTFAHEFGHAQGARHDNDTNLTPFAYAHGFQQFTNTWRTIMAVFNVNIQRLNYWSNPGITSPVAPIVPMGTAAFRDNARALDAGEATVKAHRIAPSTDTLTNDTVGADEIADKFATTSLVVTNYTASSGSKVTLRSENKVTLSPGFQADSGSDVRVFIEP